VKTILKMTNTEKWNIIMMQWSEILMRRRNIQCVLMPMKWENNGEIINENENISNK